MSFLCKEIRAGRMKLALLFFYLPQKIPHIKKRIHKTKKEIIKRKRKNNDN